MTKQRTHFLAGLLGGFAVIGLILVLVFSNDLFNYKVEIRKININSSNLPKPIEKIQSTKSTREILLNELKEEKLIMTPQEYTNNIVNYFNTALLILSAMIVIFSMLGFVYLKSLVTDQITSVLNSEDFQKQVIRKIIGRAQESFREQYNARFEAIDEKVESMDHRLVKIDETISRNNTDSEEEIIS